MNIRKMILLCAIGVGVTGIAGIGGFLFASKQNNVVRRADADSSISSDASSEASSNGLIKDSFDGSVTYNGVRYEYNTAIDTVLFLGVDNSDQSREGIGITEGGRSDAIILFVIDNENKFITPLEISRDTMVSVDIYDNDGNYLTQGIEQLTMQYSYGTSPRNACNLTKEKISDLLFRTRIDSVVSLTMDGIAPVVDAIGGVTLTLTTDETDIDPSYTEGATIHLDGEAATEFVHTRDTSMRGSNNDRMSRQTQFMLALFQTITKNGNSVLETMESAAADYLYEDIDADTMKHFTEYDYSGTVLTLPGENVAGDLHDEFYVDGDKLTEIVLDLFYKEAE